jgi:hypothetical protein
MLTVGPDPVEKCRTSVCVDRTSGARSRTPASATRTSGSGPGPLCVGSVLPTAGSRDSGAEKTQVLLRLGSGADMCPGPAWCGPVRIMLLLSTQAETRCAMWPTVRDVSQRAEPDIRPLGRAVSAFIAEKTRRLTIPLTGNVPLQHLMCHVHSAGRWPLGHPAGGVSVHCQTVRPCCEVHCAHPSSLVRCQGGFPCTPMLRRSWISGREEDCTGDVH